MAKQLIVAIGYFQLDLSTENPGRSLTGSMPAISNARAKEILGDVIVPAELLTTASASHITSGRGPEVTPPKTTVPAGLLQE